MGGPNPKYICHTFKCRNEDEASQLSFAMSRTMVGNGRKSKPDGNLEDLAADDLEQAVKMWNASALRMFHFSVGKVRERERRKEGRIRRRKRRRGRRRRKRRRRRRRRDDYA